MRKRIADKLAKGGHGAKVTIDARDVTYLLRIVNLAALKFATCQVIHGDKPKGWTCLDTLGEAANFSSKYMPEFRAEILALEHLCDGCQLRAALGE
jgi:hypothetical protein